jgi:hypothetical protein
MGRARVGVDVPGSIAEVEALWYDPRRWPAFVDGFAHVVRREDAWPRAGATLVWDSFPDGRGRVVERVIAYAEGTGQSAQVEDPRLRGTQTVAFEALEEGIAISLALEYRLKRSGPLRAATDVFFVRRAIRDSLRRTLVRFGRELASDRELLREPRSR